MVYQFGEEIIEMRDETQARPAIPGIIKSDDADDINELYKGTTLKVLPLKNMVMFPGVMAPVTVTRPKAVKLVQQAHTTGELLCVVAQRENKNEDPDITDLYEVGVAAHVISVMDLPSEAVLIILEGVERVKVNEYTVMKSTKQIRANVTALPEDFPKRNDKEFLALVSSIKETAIKIVNSKENMPANAGMSIQNIMDPVTLVNYVCVTFGLKTSFKQSLLEETVIPLRGLKLLEQLNKEQQILQMKENIQEKTRQEIDKEQREYYLHHQLETIQKELGDTGAQAVNEMKKRAEQKKWSEAVQKTFNEELARLQRMSSHSSEYAMQQNYLETLLDLPWGEYTVDNFDMTNAQSVLDHDHYGMEKIKERIIEHLAVLKLTSLRTSKSPILCLYGPPGVGKTSLGKSIATALGRKYARISLGGLHDEAEIRGHRRTYIGAMPGRIIENIRKTQSGNPVFVLDEIDKIGSDYKGDPTSALLEVLDPEQNNAFHDNYLDVDYDLSKVMFIATANSLDSIPRPLLDRMELIEMTGYLQEEKVEIAKRHLLPKELENHGLKSSQLRIKKDILDYIIDGYTRESGVRGLSRQIAAICRKVVAHVAKDELYNVSLTKEDVNEYLGKPRFSRDAWETNKYIGVVTGLAWTQVGGEILFIETSLSPAKQPTLTLTGNLGDVMKESATLAMGYIKAHADDFGIKRKDIDSQSVHIHVPEGATPKDGPSAGITITTALVSAFTRRKVRERIAMTGEMTLRGKVLPIGGVKEKILAAKRAGITDLVLCNDNKKDVEAIPQKYVKGLRFHYVSDIKEVIDFALL